MTNLDLVGCTGLTAVGTLPALLMTLWLDNCTGLSARVVARIRKELPECEIYGP